MTAKQPVSAPYSFAARIAEKQASREADAEALKSGAKTREQLTSENAWIKIAYVDWSKVSEAEFVEQKNPTWNVLQLRRWIRRQQRGAK